VQVYTTGESDTEFEVPFTNLSKVQRELRMKFLWHRAYAKARGASHILIKFGDLNKKIYIYGAKKKLKRNEDKAEIEVRPTNCVIMPDSQFNSYWNLVMTILLLYTASFMPYKISFIDSTSLSNIIFDTAIDCFFISDILINFLTAYEDPKIGLEVRVRRIAANYLFTWFIFDIFSW